jgi:hypothetical protein
MNREDFERCRGVFANHLANHRGDPPTSIRIGDGIFEINGTLTGEFSPKARLVARILTSLGRPIVDGPLMSVDEGLLRHIAERLEGGGRIERYLRRWARARRRGRRRSTGRAIP